MKFSTDSYFHIGHAHLTSGKPCQDHALSFFNGTTACAIISDGCSTGGNTDMGARILTFATLQAIFDHTLSNGGLSTARASISARQQQLIKSVQPMLGLERDDLLATCVYAYTNQDGAVIQVTGDGVVAWKTRGGSLVMQRYDWAENTPFYPVYEAEGVMAFCQHHGSDMRAIRLNEQTFAVGSNEITELQPVGYTLQQGIAGIPIEISREQMRELEYIAVFSDGVTQIDGVDWKDAVVQLLAFKTSAGEFAKRRMIRAIRDMQRVGKGPLDDISYAVIHLEHETETV